METALLRLVAEAPRRARPHAVVVAAGRRRFEVRSIDHAVPVAATLLAQLDRPHRALRAVYFNRGLDLYLPAPQPTAGWVLLPRSFEYYVAPAAYRMGLRNDWIRILARAGGGTRRALTQMAGPELRLLLVRHAGRAFRAQQVTHAVQRHRELGYCGGRTSPTQGTRPVPDLTGVLAGVVPALALGTSAGRTSSFEPECYLPTISSQEGRMETVNAYDGCAGVSLGPIQFNVTDGHLFNFLHDLATGDPMLFSRVFGRPLGWATSLHAGHRDLRVNARGQMLHGTRSAADREVNSRYFQRGQVFAARRRPDCSDFRRDSDLAWRHRLTGLFRDAVVWPHVQQFVVGSCVGYLTGGLTRLDRAGFARLDPARWDTDAYVVKAVAMSAYVRFAAGLGPLLVNLQGTSSQRRAEMNRRLDSQAAWNAAVDAHLRTQPRLTPRRRATLRNQLRGLRRRLLEARHQATVVEPQVRALVAAAVTWARQTPARQAAPAALQRGRPRLLPLPAPVP